MHTAGKFIAPARLRLTQHDIFIEKFMYKNYILEKYIDMTNSTFPILVIDISNPSPIITGTFGSAI